MVLQRMLDYRFNGYQVSEVPRSCRSARGRGAIRKRLEGNNKRSFEVLASVAGKSLEKCDNSLQPDCEEKQHTTCDNIISRKKVDEGELFKEETLDLDSSIEKTVVRCPGYQDHYKHLLDGSFHPRENFNLEINPMSKDFSQSGMLSSDDKDAFDDSHFVPDAIEGKVSGNSERKVEAEPTKRISGRIKDESVTVTGSLEDLMKLEVKPPPLVGPEDDAHASFTQCNASVQVVSRDDDESSRGSAHPSTMVKAFGPPPDTGNKRIKKMSETSHRGVAPDVKEGNYYSTDGKVKEVSYDERTHYERTQKIYPFKKRKFFNQEFSTSDRGFNQDGAFISSDKRTNGKHCTAVTATPSSITDQQVSPNSKECNVKLSIKSFKVPELFIDIPTTATVGSLKRTVMDAVTSILGEGLHVGILVQGKKIRDDDKTLVQTGISQDEEHSNLGFILEPKHSQNATSPCSKKKSLLSRIRHQGLTRHVSLTLQQGTSNVSLHSPSKNLGGSVESDLNGTPILADTLSNNKNYESKALVAVPRSSTEALAVVPFHRKSGPHEYVQRRIRRPFSVSEVEALVRAVEKLGTGRWRDVKFHAFDNAKHRTYVDLKDKWKTLVHTAGISPQQRRGEPVPQELLDRVLAAQAYWSHRQVKQQAKVTL